jgi:predicted GIY-YIG superfamily endonuclease
MTDLYRHYRADGELLYIGISVSALNRLVQHRRDAHWYKQIERVEVKKIPSDQAAAIEKLAIEREKPLFNIRFSLEKKEARRVPVRRTPQDHIKLVLNS